MARCRYRPAADGGERVGRQFKNALGFEQDIAAILLETALSPEFLELELTESVLVEVSREHDDVLQRLRKAGLHIAIDDFGTGYSSLEYLGRLPVNRIKIAQNFMIGLKTGSSNATIVKTAIGMAHELGLDVVVEGVETAEQLDLIRSFNGHKVQGSTIPNRCPLEEQRPCCKQAKSLRRGQSLSRGSR